MCLEVEAILVLCNLADLFAKFYSRTFLSLYHIIIYIICILALYIYKYSMKVDYVDLIPVVAQVRRECLSDFYFRGEGLEGLCGANV